jgi:hypothetical protein
MMILRPLQAIFLALFSAFFAFSMDIPPAKQSMASSGAHLLGATSADESEFDEGATRRFFSDMERKKYGP